MLAVRYVVVNVCSESGSVKYYQYTVYDVSKLWLSPYVKISEKEGALVFTQFMFRTAVQLKGEKEHLAELKRILEGGVDGDELRQWGSRRFLDFSAWVDCAMRAGVIE